MAAKKRPVTQEPLRNTVARKLGNAAGTLANAMHEFTENLSALPEKLATKVRKTANVGSPKSRPRHPKKTIGRAAAAPGKAYCIAGGKPS
jgi:hypothetical protein